MSKTARLLFVAASVLLSGMFVLPIWSIGLLAPQYPEGLGMVIRLTTVEGATEHDLTNINELNHYIGMKIIDANAIPELRFMPWIVGTLVGLGLLVALTGSRKLGWGWVGGVTAFAIAGLADFWRWTYDYGHHLDVEHAIIKVPGMAYQPPIIGSKQILNFTATSWPDVGTYAAAAAVALAVVALVVLKRPHAESKKGTPGERRTVARVQQPAEVHG